MDGLLTCVFCWRCNSSSTCISSQEGFRLDRDRRRNLLQRSDVYGVFERLVNCFDYGGGGSSVAPDAGIGGGGAGTGGGTGGGTGTGNSPGIENAQIPAEKLVDRKISARLQCVLDSYADPDVKLGLGQSMRSVDVYAFGIKNQYGEWGYVVRETNTSPGPEWTPVAGITAPRTAYGRMYKVAFEGGNYRYDGERNGVSNRLSGYLNDFEKSIFVSMHEASHLKGNEKDEVLANWYGIDAVLKFRADGGKKCPKNPADTPPK